MKSSRFACALITGASAGLGAEFARQLVLQCDAMVLVARRAGRLSALADELAAATDGRLRVLAIEADLSEEGACEAVLARVEEAGLGVDLLINNAGLGDYGEFATSEWDKLEAMLKVNIEALTRLTHLVVPGMIRRGGGDVLNVSSLASLLPIPDFAVYAATKAYVSSFSEALKIELKEHGIGVTALCPGPVHTEFGAVAARSEEKSFSGREWFYVSQEKVVSEALAGLRRGAPRVYPGLQVLAAAAVLSVLPMVAVRLMMSFRPRR